MMLKDLISSANGTHGRRTATPTPHRIKRGIPPRAAALLCLYTLVAGCDSGSKSAAPGSNKVRVGYIGLTCEAPIFTAYEKGFFKEEGLDVSLVKCEWANYKDVLALGGFDVTHHLVMYFLKPVEQGLDVKFTGGIHRAACVFKR
jgi:NitT/TauT family transport system substrate-binding protein